MAVLYSSTVFCSWLIVLADGTWTGVLLRTTVSASGRRRLLLYSALSSTLEIPRLAEVTKGVGRARRASGSCWGERLGVAARSPLPVLHLACRRPPAQRPPRRGHTDGGHHWPAPHRDGICLATAAPPPQAPHGSSPFRI